MQPGAAALGAVAVLTATPWLAGLTRTVPDRANRRWWRPVRVSAPRWAVTAAAGAAAGALAGAAAGWSAAWPAWVALALALTPLAIIDVQQHRLPDRLVLPAAVLGAVLLAVAADVRGEPGRLGRAALAAAAVGAVLLLLALISPSGFGLGDVKLGALLGGYLGWRGWQFVVPGLFTGFVLGALVALALVVTRRASLRTEIAFGPALMLGSLLIAAAG